MSVELAPGPELGIAVERRGADESSSPVWTPHLSASHLVAQKQTLR